MKKIEAKIVADSINPQGERITTYILTFPRFILAELNTHRVFSKNSASSRAIPFEKMVKMVKEDPFIPIAWQKDHKGMQGTKYMIGEDADQSKILWDISKNEAINAAIDLHNHGITKQLCNRLLEPFMWHTVLLTGTEFENFFELRCPIYRAFGNVFKSKKDCIEKYPANINLTDLDWLKATESQAEIHMQALAEAMWDAMNESTPKKLKEGEWHIPFGDRIDLSHSSVDKFKYEERGLTENEMNLLELKISTARCARLSYMTFDGKVDYEKDIKLHDTLLESQHASPFEHCCRVLTEEEYNILGKMVLHPENGWVFENGWVDNFRGFISYRRILNI